MAVRHVIQYALKNVRMDEAAFIKNMRSASEIRDKSEVKKLKADLSKKEKRFTDLDLLIKKVYEDNAMGKLLDRRYEMLSSDYEKEQQEIEIVMEEIREKLTQFEDDTDRTEEFLSLVHKYTDIQELTPAIVNEFVDKIMVHKIEKTDGDRMQEIEIFIREIQEKLMQFEEDTDRTEEFLSLVHKYTDIQELTPAIVNEFVDKIMVHKIEKTDGDRMQEIEIFLNYIGKVELPAQELSEEEMAEEEKKRKRRQNRREYQKA